MSNQILYLSDDLLTNDIPNWKLRMGKLLAQQFLAILFLIFAQFTYADSWEKQFISSAKSFRSVSPRAIAIDTRTGYRHIAYGNDYLYHAVLNGADWQIEVVDPCPGLDGHACIAMDSKSGVHIAYFSRFGLKYAHRDENGKWKIMKISTRIRKWISGVYVVGWSSSFSMTIDANDKVHIGYFDDILKDNHLGIELNYATNSSGKWNFARISEAFGIGDIVEYGLGIAIDSKNHIHMSYPVYGELRYVTNESGRWRTTIIDSDQSGYQKGPSSIAIDSHDGIHIVSYEGERTRYAYRPAISVPHPFDEYASNNFWFLFDVPNVSNRYFRSCSIAVDSHDRMHAVFDSIYDLTYVTRSEGNWKSEVFKKDEFRWFPWGASIAVDKGDNKHICYLTTYEGKDILTTYMSGMAGPWPGWFGRSVDAGWNIQGKPIITTDSNGAIHLLYKTDNNLRYYATNASGSWVTSLIEPMPASQFYDNPTWIAVDTSNVVHITYMYPHGVYYCTNASGSWVTSKIENGAEYQYRTIGAMKVDSTGQIVFAYINSSGIQYITRAPQSSSWSVTTIATGYDSRTFARSLVIDSNNKLHVAGNVIQEGTDYGRYLIYGTNLNGSWTERLIMDDENDYNYESFEIALDTKNNAHIIYVRYPESYNRIFYPYIAEIRYATNRSGEWVAKHIAQRIRIGYSNISVSVDENDHVHFALGSTFSFISDSPPLVYLTNASGAWKTSKIDFNGKYPSVVTSSQGSAKYIVYNSGATQDLMCATNAEPAHGPDLFLSYMTAPNHAKLGSKVLINSEIINKGVSDAGQSSVEFYLSRIGSMEKILLLNKTILATSAGETSLMGSTSVRMPKTIKAGDYQLTMDLDPNNEVDESDEDNNILSKRISIFESSPPDLVIRQFAVQEMQKRGQPILMYYSIENIGCSTSGSSIARLYGSASTGERVLIASIPIPLLRPREKHERSIFLTIPAQLQPGTYNAIMEADAEQVIFESNETNNTLSRSIRIP